jgi:hypothetical protein
VEGSSRFSMFDSRISISNPKSSISSEPHTHSHAMTHSDTHALTPRFRTAHSKVMQSASNRKMNFGCGLIDLFVLSTSLSLFRLSSFPFSTFIFCISSAVCALWSMVFGLQHRAVRREGCVISSNASPHFPTPSALVPVLGSGVVGLVVPPMG